MSQPPARVCALLRAGRLPSDPRVFSSGPGLGDTPSGHTVLSVEGGSSRRSIRQNLSVCLQPSAVNWLQSAPTRWQPNLVSRLSGVSVGWNHVACPGGPEGEGSGYSANSSAAYINAHLGAKQFSLRATVTFPTTSEHHLLSDSFA